jgi:uncharacterized RDD family membrane protein YckC
MQWHYFHNGQTLGPVSGQDLEVLIKVGTLAPDVLVWTEGMSDWQSYSSAKSLAQPVRSGSQSSGLRIEAIRREAEPSASTLPPNALRSPQKPAVETAPLGHRLVAKLIDFVVLGICIVVIAVIVQWVWSVAKQTDASKGAMKSVIRVAMVAIGLMLAAFYRKASDTSDSSGLTTGRRSPGKNLMKLYVVDVAGRPIGFSTKLARFVIQVLMVGGIFFPCLILLTAISHFSHIRPPPPAFARGPQPLPSHSPASMVGKFLLVAAFSFTLSQAGYAIALFNRERRGLHDLLCGTRVVHTP